MKIGLDGADDVCILIGMNKLNQANTLKQIETLSAKLDAAQARIYREEGGGTLKSFNRAMDARDRVWGKQFELAEKIWLRRDMQPDLYSDACCAGFMDYGDDEFEGEGE